jgi:hypothetical protein
MDGDFSRSGKGPPARPAIIHHLFTLSVLAVCWSSNTPAKLHHPEIWTACGATGARGFAFDLHAPGCTARRSLLRMQRNAGWEVRVMPRSLAPFFNERRAPAQPSPEEPRVSGASRRAGHRRAKRRRSWPQTMLRDAPLRSRVIARRSAATTKQSSRAPAGALKKALSTRRLSRFSCALRARWIASLRSQ